MSPSERLHLTTVKGTTSRFAHVHVEQCAQIFQALCLKSVLIFAIFNHPCSFMVYHSLFGVSLS